MAAAKSNDTRYKGGMERETHLFVFIVLIVLIFTSAITILTVIHITTIIPIILAILLTVILHIRSGLLFSLHTSFRQLFHHLQKLLAVVLQQVIGYS
jgi:hypothetical protein